MITNLLEEYNFFYKYPEEQLKSAAALFGLVIKHRLVTQAALGIALWGVLDALRKPADSKMFVFGTEALEQFLDCLIEWPQYCNFVLQISHLHPKLVEPVKHALSHISSVHAELDIGHNHDRSQASTTIVEMPSMSIGQGGISHSGLRGPPTFQVPQRQVMSLEEKKISTAVSTYMKQASHPAGEPLPVISSDMAGIQKPHSAVNASLAHSSTLGLARSSRSTSTKFGSALNIGTLVAAAERRKTPIEAPASEIQDKISFIFNNLSPDNLEAKAKEFSEILKEQYYAWFAQYLVMKRASIEYNFHELYLKFLDKVNLKPLNNEIVQASYENCKVLLGSELIKSSSEERSLLKNLGSWLGKITIGKNQVLRAREIDPKALIIEAYEKGLMIAVVPFTSKILDSCSISLAYQPPNPWTMAILGLLSEIYVMPNLKMNIKFEIEVLFKNLNVDLKDVTPTSLLKDRIREVEGNPDFSNNVGLSHPQMVNEAKSGIIATLNQLDLPLDVTNSHPTGHSRVLSQCASPLYLASGTLTPDEKLPPAQGVLQGQSKYSVNQLFTPASNIEQQVVVNPKLHTQGLYLHFQRVLPTTMDRAIKDIVYSIVQCSVSIAAQTTKELVLKDYVMEPDETRICNAAHLMVAGLAGSLAHVTCKEHLRASLSSYLRNTLQGITTPSELEQAIQLVINDNLDLGCALIERAATEKAIQTIDGEIAKQLSIRRKHREGVGPMHFDSLYAQGLMGLLPEALRPLPGRLSHSQQRVYEDFVQLRGQNPSSQSSVAVPLAHSTSSSSANLSGEGASVSGQINSEMHVSGTIIPRIGVGSQTLGISSKEKDTDAAQLTSVSTRTTTGDVFSSQNLDKSTVTSYSPIGTPQLHAGEASDSVKESRAAAQPPNPTSASGTVSNISEPYLTTGDALKKYRTISEKLENLLNGNAKKQKVEEVIAEVPAVIIRCLSRDEAALAVAQKAFKGLYENGSSSVHVDAHLAILATMRDVSKLVVKELTSWVIYSDEDRKFNEDITVGLIHSELLNLAEYNVHMAKLLDAGRNKAATEFSISLIQTLVMDDSKVISELHNLVDVLAKLAARPGSPESLQRLVEIAKNPAANSVSLSGLSSEKDDNTVSSREKDSEVSGVSQEDDTAGETEEPDSVALREQVSVLFVEWYKICERPRRNDEACSSNFLEGGLLKGDNTSDYFFHLMDISVAHCLRSEVISSGTSQPDQGQPLSFLAIDIYAKLVCAILRFCSKDDGYFKLNLLTKVLAVTVKFIQEDANKKRTSFNPRPYFRIFINWILDFSLLDPVSDGNNFQALTALANAFHALQPLKCPGFSFAWLELISHRGFMPKLLIANAQKGWPYFRRLLVDLFQFMEPFLTNPELGVPVQLLYKGTLRVVLVLLHDFPEFLCYNHFSFCDVIPPSCIQLRSVILSAYPRSMKIPDPNRPDLKLDLMTEMSQPPCILSEIDAALKAKQIKAELDHYLRTRQQRSLFLSELKQKLVLSPSDAAAHSGTRYDVPLINSLVLYVGMESIQLRGPVSYQQWQYISRMDVFLGSAALNIFKSMLTDLDSEGRYLFLNAVANQLRYPNTHTFYFSFLLLSLFAETNQETIQEQITRVLMERRMANRPCPWGLEVTFMELIKNPQYNFWSRSFIRCAPEIEAFFESIFRSSGVPKPIEENVVSSGSAV